MPDSDAQLSPAELFGIVRGLCSDYVLSDLRLLSESLSALRQPSASPIRGLITSPSIEARLSFDSTFSETKSIVFGLKRRQRSDRTAEFDVDLKVTPAPDQIAAPPERVPMVGVWPRFIRQARGNGLLEIALDNSERLRFTVGQSGSEAPGGDLSATHVVQLTLAIARWIRLGDNSGPAPFSPAPNEPLDTFLAMLAERVDALLGDMAQILVADDRADPNDGDEELRRISAYRSHIASIIGPDHSSYRLARLAGRLRLVLTPTGALAADPFAKGNRRFDIEARLADSGHRSSMVVSLNIPDFLVNGAIYRGILDAVIASDAVGDLETLTPPVPKRAVIDSIRAGRASENGVVARIERKKSGTDLDMILVPGVAALRGCWMVFMFDVSFEDRSAGDMRVRTISDFRLAALVGPTGDGVGNAKDLGVLSDYLYRALRALHTWRMRFPSGGGQP